MGLLPGNLAGAEPQHYDLGVARLAIAASHRLCFSLVFIYHFSLPHCSNTAPRRAEALHKLLEIMSLTQLVTDGHHWGVGVSP
ncbi:unnamed protein product [Boreogadus saida]